MRSVSNKVYSRAKVRNRFGILSVSILGIMLAGVSCSDKTVGTPDRQEKDDGTINFRVREEKVAVRGESITLADLESVGVYGYYTGYDRWNWISVNTPSVLKADYFCNVELKQDELWTYSPLRYWPVDPAKKLSFFAYAPYADGNDPLIIPYPADGTETGIPRITYTVPPDIKEQVDLLWATNQDRNIESPQVDFMMKHALSAITLSAKFANAAEALKGYSVDIEGITIGGLHGSGSLDLGTGEWDFPSNAVPSDEYVLDNYLSNKRVVTGNVSSVPCLTNAAGLLMPIPQDLSDAFMTFKLKFTDENSNVTDNQTSFMLSDTFSEWEAGKKYHYELLIKGEFITIETSSQPWYKSGNESTGDVEL